MSRPKTWYEFHASKFEADTAHLTNEEVGAYIRLLDFHFLHDSIPSDIDRLRIILRETKQKTRKIMLVLKQFLYEKDGMFYQKRMVETISKGVEISDKRQMAGRKGGLAKAKANEVAKSYTVTDTVTVKTKEKAKRKARSRLPADWKPSQKLIKYCNDNRPELDPADVFENFRLFHSSKGSLMADWDLAAMRWVRNERATATRSSVNGSTPRESAHEKSQRIIRERADEIAKSL